MNNLLKATLLGTSLFTGAALATPTTIFVQADNVTGMAKVEYGMGNVAPKFSFQLIDSDITDNLDSYRPGQYNVDFTISGLWLDIHENGSDVRYQKDYGDDPFSISGGPVTLGDLPSLSGMRGPLSWDLDIHDKFLSFEYDFDDDSNVDYDALASFARLFTFSDVYDLSKIPDPSDLSALSNEKVNQILAGLDFKYSGEANGIMDAKGGWEHMRVELVPVPEPSMWLLLGTGLLGFGWVRRKAA